MLSPQTTIENWLIGTHTPLDVPPYVRAAYRQRDREERAEGAHWIDWPVEDLTKLCQIFDQERLEFSEEDTHANVRGAVAHFLERVVIPGVADPSINKLPARLRDARQHGVWMFHPQRQKFITIWDTKAGLPLLCPDDAREEAMRVQRRYLPELVKWRNSGKAIHQGVFTLPNYQPGTLRTGMKKIFRRFSKLRKKFPQIKGALCILEAPLSRHRDWNVHLNVILMCDGFLDYGELRRAWHWDVEIDRVRGGEEDIKGALRELIKYAVRAVSEKSMSKNSMPQQPALSPAGEGTCSPHAVNSIATSSAQSVSPSAGPPPMTQWTADEWLEWWRAHKKFRRTRSYGLLFGVEKPEAESLDGFISIGSVSRQGGKLFRRSPLLDSIPGDKSIPMSWTERLKRAIQRMTGPPDELRRMPSLLQEVEKRWHTMH